MNHLIAPPSIPTSPAKSYCGILWPDRAKNREECDCSTCLNLSTEKLAKLTPEEDRIWTKYITFYIDDGWTDEKADKKAWEDLITEFPRLKEFQGALP